MTSNFMSTRQAAQRLGVLPGRLSRSIWEGRLHAPFRGPSGNYLWTLENVEHACWRLFGCSLEQLSDKREAMAL